MASKGRRYNETSSDLNVVRRFSDQMGIARGAYVQLAERSLPTQEYSGSYPVLAKFGNTFRCAADCTEQVDNGKFIKILFVQHLNLSLVNEFKG